jgi:hypothetical protein
MKNKDIVLKSLAHALGVMIYVFAVGWFMFNIGSFMGNVNGFIGIPLMLLLLIVSATITGSLVLGRPIMLYIDGDKKEAVKFLVSTIVWLLLILVVYLVSLVIAT